jgi:hypothetical protein
MIDHRSYTYLRLAMHVKYYWKHFLFFLTLGRDLLGGGLELETAIFSSRSLQKMKSQPPAD